MNGIPTPPNRYQFGSSHLSRASSIQSLNSTSRNGHRSTRFTSPTPQYRVMDTPTFPRTQNRSQLDSPHLSRAASIQSLNLTSRSERGHCYTPQRFTSPTPQDPVIDTPTLSRTQSRSQLDSPYLPRAESTQSLNSNSPREHGHHSNPQRLIFPTQTHNRKQLETQLEKYISYTFSCIKTVKNFCDEEANWADQMMLDIEKMNNIKISSQKKFLSLTRRELEGWLGAVLGSTLRRLDKLHLFLDAVEKLAVTSLPVFMEESFQLDMVNLKPVQSVICTARAISPVLILFKRDYRAFFQSDLENMDVLIFQLEKYIATTYQLCKILRMDESFRLMFLFNGYDQDFINIYCQRYPEMLKFLSELKAIADKLDKKKKNFSISNVTSSSLGAVGCVLTITGLALAPVTAGLSLGFTVAGVSLGVASGGISLITGATSMAYKHRQRKNANNIFQNFREDVDDVLGCLEDIASSQRPADCVDGGNTAFGAVKLMATAGSVVKGIDKLVNGGKSFKALKDAYAVRHISMVSTQVISKAVRIGSFAANALFLGLDLVTIYKESQNLAKGKKSKASQLIFSRAALWNSEVQSWNKIYYTLNDGKNSFQRNEDILYKPFYP